MLNFRLSCTNSVSQEPSLCRRATRLRLQATCCEIGSSGVLRLLFEAVEAGMPQMVSQRAHRELHCVHCADSPTNAAVVGDAPTQVPDLGPFLRCWRLSHAPGVWFIARRTKALGGHHYLLPQPQRAHDEGHLSEHEGGVVLPKTSRNPRNFRQRRSGDSFSRLCL